jgi:hypothetical protein
MGLLFMPSVALACIVGGLAAAEFFGVDGKINMFWDKTHLSLMVVATGIAVLLVVANLLP